MSRSRRFSCALVTASRRLVGASSLLAATSGRRPLRGLLLAALLFPGGLAAQQADTARLVTRYQWFGAGRLRLLDTYLSPLEYSGPSIGLFHLSERPARWGRGHVTVQGQYAGRLSYTRSQTDEGRDWEGGASAAVAWHRNWRPSPRWRLAAGGFGETALGFVYNTRNGNNPAQGRFDIAVGFSGLAVCDFRLLRQPLSFRTQVDVPLAGAMFTPNYNQSYYEIFSLGHYDRNIRFTHPFNAPSARLLATVQLPLFGAILSVGYMGDVRQAAVNGLKRHFWNHQFIIGYVRTFSRVRHRR